jgi:hypothetical protein
MTDKLINEIIDVTKAPTGNIIDRRGYKAGDLIVIGFADIKPRTRLKNDKSPHWVGKVTSCKTIKTDNENYWWVDRNGEILRWGWKAVKKYERFFKLLKIAGIKNINPKGWTDEEAERYRAAKSEYQKCADTIDK